MPETTTTDLPAPKPCNCIADTDGRLREKGYKISNACSHISVTAELGLKAVYCLPVERVDGARLKRSEGRAIQISHCPFCGQKL